MSNSNGKKIIWRIVDKMLFCFAMLVVTGAGAAAAQDDVVILSDAERSEIAVTVYNRNLALVREVRGADLPGGDFNIEFQDVPSLIEARSLIVDADGCGELRLLEQNYEFDLMSREKILEKYVGRQLTWEQETGGRITGTLLGMAAGPVYEVDGEIVFEVPGRIVLPTLPQDLRARPTLIWKVWNDREGDCDIEATYLTRGLSWSADYVLQLDPAGTTGSLRSWVSVDNRCGTAFRDAKLLLVAGDINQAPSRRGPEDVLMMAESAVKSSAGQVVEESLYDYHLYTLPGVTTLKDAQIKQVSLFVADEIEVARRYRVSAGGWFYRGSGGSITNPDVAIHYAFENREEKGLGMPLPAGVVRVYGESSSGQRQLLGEDRIDHTPKKEEIELLVGNAFDIVAERRRLDYRRTGGKLHETDFKMVLKNRKDEDVVVEVLEIIGGDWRLLEASLESTKPAADRLRFDVPVPADGETTVTWTVQVTTG